jgi:LPXTG-site transpeptidase (sortase) family protein
MPMAKRFITFLATFVAVFMLHIVVLGMADALPEPIEAAEVVAEGSNTTAVNIAPGASATAATATAELPVRVVAKSIGLDVAVLNPNTTDVKALDEELLKGSVRYPDSALLGTEGTVLLFGHSSYLPIVRNQNFKAFNGIQKLKVGETVSVYSDGSEYRYAVTGVRLANAKEDVVELPATGQHLVMVTCDSFGTKSDRYVLTADLLGVYQK